VAGRSTWQVARSWPVSSSPAQVKTCARDIQFDGALAGTHAGIWWLTLWAILCRCMAWQAPTSSSLHAHITHTTNNTRLSCSDSTSSSPNLSKSVMIHIHAELTAASKHACLHAFPGHDCFPTSPSHARLSHTYTLATLGLTDNKPMPAAGSHTAACVSCQHLQSHQFAACGPGQTTIAGGSAQQLSCASSAYRVSAVQRSEQRLLCGDGRPLSSTKTQVSTYVVSYFKHFVQVFPHRVCRQIYTLYTHDACDACMCPMHECRHPRHTACCNKRPPSRRHALVDTATA